MIDRNKLTDYLAGIDSHLQRHAILFIYGSAAFILLGEENRVSVDIDVAGPYTIGDYNDIAGAAEKSNIPVNPDPIYAGDHIEWVAATRLSLPPPNPDTDLILWRGARLTVKTVSAAKLIVSKLPRYDETDQSDIRFLCRQSNITLSDIDSAFHELPAVFKNDVVVRDNFEYLGHDLERWIDH